MIKIRLAREGRKKHPKYRIVAIDERKKREGAVIDVLGFWIPKKREKKIDMDKLKRLRELGAQETQAVKNLISK